MVVVYGVRVPAACEACVRVCACASVYVRAWLAYVLVRACAWRVCVRVCVCACACMSSNVALFKCLQFKSSARSKVFLFASKEKSHEISCNDSIHGSYFHSTKQHCCITFTNSLISY